MGFTLMGETMQRILPLPIPASVYGLVLLFASLCAGIVKLEQVKETGHFLVSILPILFVTPTVSILEHWNLIAPRLIPIAALILGSTMLTFGISGTVTRLISKKEDSGHD